MFHEFNMNEKYLPSACWNRQHSQHHKTRDELCSVSCNAVYLIDFPLHIPFLQTILFFTWCCDNLQEKKIEIEKLAPFVSCGTWLLENSFVTWSRLASCCICDNFTNPTFDIFHRNGFKTISRCIRMQSAYRHHAVAVPSPHSPWHYIRHDLCHLSFSTC